ncbi:MAG TPA: hypothetical protein VM345_09055 [Acidimicrobiales bacterium]|nr:hypothetical protein [Acidimicrobiales bacterium]
MTDTPFVRRVLAAAAATCLIAAVLAAAIVAGGDGDSDQLVAGNTVSSTSTSSSTVVGALAADPTAPPAAAGAGDDEGDGGGATGAPAATPTTAADRSHATPSTAAPPPTTAAASGPSPAATFADLGPGDPGPTVVPKPGTYRYSVRRGESSQEGTITIEDRGAAPNGGRALMLRLKNLPADIDNDVVWGPDEMRVAKSTFMFGATPIVCDWEPDHVELKLALSKGATWTSSTACAAGGYVVKRSSSNVVSDARRVKVAGEEVAVWVISTKERFELNGGVQEATSTTWFSPKHGLMVRSVAESSQGRMEIEALSLQPS